MLRLLLLIKGGGTIGLDGLLHYGVLGASTCARPASGTLHERSATPPVRFAHLPGSSPMHQK